MFKKNTIFSFSQIALPFCIITGSCFVGSIYAQAEEIEYTKTTQSRTETYKADSDSNAPSGTRPVHSFQAKRARLSDSAVSTNDGRTPLGFDTDDSESDLESNMNARTGESLHKLDNKRVDGQ